MPRLAAVQSGRAPFMTMRAKFRWLLIFAALTGGCVIRTASTTTAPGAVAAAPMTAEECKRCNGDWGQHGIVQQESCLCRTSDQGKECRDGDECQGQCLLSDPAQEEVVDQGPPRRGYFVGRCSEFVQTFGCYALVLRGARRQGPVPLDEPPAQICAD